MDKRRFTNWWIHWEDLHWPNPDSRDAIKRKAEKYAQANITSAIIFGCHFRWDYLPFFTILHDYLATVAEELGKYNKDKWSSLELCLKNKPDKHTHDDLIGVTPDNFFKMAFNAATKIKDSI